MGEAIVQSHSMQMKKGGLRHASVEMLGGVSPAALEWQFEVSPLGLVSGPFLLE